MILKSIISATCFCLAVASSNVKAEPIQSDWLTIGEEWQYAATVDISELLPSFAGTVSYTGWGSRNDEPIYSLDDLAGRPIEEWQELLDEQTIPEEIQGEPEERTPYEASIKRVVDYLGTQVSNGLFNESAPSIDNTFCTITNTCVQGDRYAIWEIGDLRHAGDLLTIIPYDLIYFTNPDVTEEDEFELLYAYYDAERGRTFYGSTSPVPEPHTLLLFSTGLLLLRVARRKV